MYYAFGRWENPWLIQLMGVGTGGRETIKCSYISCNIKFIEMVFKKKQFSDGNHPVWGEAVISVSPVGGG